MQVTSDLSPAGLGWRVDLGLNTPESGFMAGIGCGIESGICGGVIIKRCSHPSSCISIRRN